MPDGILFDVGTRNYLGNPRKPSRLIAADATPRPVAPLRRARVPLAAKAVRFAEQSFKAWFQRNFVSPRAGMIGLRPYARAGALDDSLPASIESRGRNVWYSEAYERAVADYVEPTSYIEEAFLREHPLVAVQMMFGVTDVRGLRCYMRGLSHEIARMQRRAYRSRYYARDNARRRELAAERRKMRRRTTLNACPTPDEFREAFARAKLSKEARVRFGSMVEDLSCYVDNSLRFDMDGNVVGRNGGIRAWIVENVPELTPKYKTIMRYKALAMRFKQAAGLCDPEPAERVLDDVKAVTSRTAGALSTSGRRSSAARHARMCYARLQRVRAALAEARNTWDELFGAADRALAEEEAPNSG